MEGAREGREEGVEERKCDARHLVVDHEQGGEVQGSLCRVMEGRQGCRGARVSMLKGTST